MRGGLARLRGSPHHTYLIMTSSIFNVVDQVLLCRSASSPVCLSICLFVCLFVFCLSVCLPVCLSVYLSVCLPARLSGRLPACLFRALPSGIMRATPHIRLSWGSYWTATQYTARRYGPSEQQAINDPQDNHPNARTHACSVLVEAKTLGRCMNYRLPPSDWEYLDSPVH